MDSTWIDATYIWNWIKYICKFILPENPDFMKLFYTGRITWPKLNINQIENLIEEELQPINRSELTFIDDFNEEANIFESEYSIKEHESFWRSLMNEIKPKTDANITKKENISIINYCKAQVNPVFIENGETSSFSEDSSLLLDD